jgi:hypothetical protein
MKNIYSILYILFLSAGFSSLLFSQPCEKFFKKGDCGMDIEKDYKIYSQSKSVAINLQDTIEFNIVFYGQKEYLFSFCTDKNLYPVHFRLIDPDTGELLYDNSDDRYLESLIIGFDVTRSLTIKIHVLGETSSRPDLEGYTGCVGALFQYKNY